MKNPFTERPTFVAHAGIELAEATADRAVARLVINDNHHQPYGVVHGGVYCTLSETAASTGAALWAMAQGMAGAVGVTNITDFLRATSDGVLVAEATPVHRGRTQQLWRVTIVREEDGKMAAQSQVRLQNVNTTEL
ncbi:MAG: PaaI family thioesterase [Actinobacteria bacterium]|nr:PaaI family thioesterase [Actinomycetota bacterium]MCI0679146.1 PaaI family thioesterase [Actinomycetota bacterium]